MALTVLLLEIALVVGGVGILYAASEGLVRGASNLASALGVTTVVIGLTVVAFGTSAPEMLIGAIASLEQAETIALGNVVGSNIANIGLILGAAAVFTPLQIRAAEVGREIGGVLASAGLVIVLALDGIVGLWDGVVLLVALAAFLSASAWSAVRGRHRAQPTDDDAPPLRRWDAVLVALGLGGVALGAWMTVRGAAALAGRVGVPEVVIGLTVVALGTSLPELATSLVAAVREEADISVGNVLGSNLFNALAVLGLAAVIAPIPVDPGTLQVGLPVMAGFSVALVPLARPGFVLDRPKGVALLLAFGAFWVVLGATGGMWTV